MLADFEADLLGFLDHPGRVELLRSVLRLTTGAAALDGCGPLTSLTGASIGLPPSGGVRERGASVAEIGAYLDAGDLFTGVATPARTALSLFRGHEDWASGMNDLEDEHGLVNVVCSMGVWNRYRRVARDSPALIVRGILERSVEGVVNVLADAFEDLRTGVTHRSRDFR